MKTTPSSTSYFVYHGGSLYGQGVWSGPHATREEADESRYDCQRVVGGTPFIEAKEVEKVEESSKQPSPWAGMTGPESYYHGANARSYHGD